MGSFSSPGTTQGTTPGPRWATPLTTVPAPVTTVGAEATSPEYQLVSGFGGLNPEEAAILGGTELCCCTRLCYTVK